MCFCILITHRLDFKTTFGRQFRPGPHVESTQLNPTDRVSPYLWAPAVTNEAVYKPGMAQTSGSSDTHNFHYRQEPTA
jgi:hypothetical protein